MNYKNICTRREYEAKGAKKVVWLNCGTLKTMDDGKMFIELNMFPGTSFFVFEKKERAANHDTETKGWDE